MKKILTMSLMLLFAFMVSAQNQNRGGGFRLSEEEQTKRYEELKKELALKPAQLDSIKAIDKRFNDEIRKAREAGNNTDRDARRALSEKRTESIKKVLTKEQFTKYEALQAKWREARGNRQPRQ